MTKEGYEGVVYGPISRSVNMKELPPKEWIIFGASAIFYGLCLCMWIVAKIFPAWDRRQVEKAKRNRIETGA